MDLRLTPLRSTSDPSEEKAQPGGRASKTGDERGPTAVLIAAETWPPWRGMVWARTVKSVAVLLDSVSWQWWKTSVASLSYLLAAHSFNSQTSKYHNQKGNILENCKFLDRNQRLGEHWYSVASSCRWLGFENREEDVRVEPFSTQMVFMNEMWTSEPCILIIKWGFLGSRWNAHSEQQGASFAQRIADCIQKALDQRRRQENYLVSLERWLFWRRANIWKRWGWGSRRENLGAKSNTYSLTPS